MIVMAIRVVNSANCAVRIHIILAHAQMHPHIPVHTREISVVCLRLDTQINAEPTRKTIIIGKFRKTEHATELPCCHQQGRKQLC